MTFDMCMIKAVWTQYLNQYITQWQYPPKHLQISFYYTTNYLLTKEKMKTGDLMSLLLDDTVFMFIF